MVSYPGFTLLLSRYCIVTPVLILHYLSLSIFPSLCTIFLFSSSSSEREDLPVVVIHILGRNVPHGWPLASSVSFGGGCSWRPTCTRASCSILISGRIRPEGEVLELEDESVLAGDLPLEGVELARGG